MNIPLRFTLLATAVAGLARLSAQQADTAKPAGPATRGEGVVQLESVEVSAQTGARYVPDTATQVGPLGAKDLLDTPFSINVITNDLIRNTQAATADDIFKLSPVVQFTSPQSRFFPAATLRGFSTNSTKRIDGIPSSESYVNVDLEDKESVEIITGLSGFLYGIGNVGGTVNYVLKRPTAERLNRLTVGNTSGANLYAHADLGGPIDAAGKFGYRVNVLGQDGDTAVEDQTIRRQFVSAAFDWHLTETLTLQVDASHSHYRMEGTEPYWATTAGVEYPDAPDADEYYGQSYSFTESNQYHVGGGLRWEISPDVTLRTKYARRESNIELLAVNNTFVAGAPGDYIIGSGHWEYPDVTTDGGSLLVDINFDTGSIEHRVTTGYYGDINKRTQFNGPGWLNDPTVYNVSNPPDLSALPPPPTADKYRANESTYHNFILADDVRFTKRWSALAGVNRSTIDTEDFNAAGVSTAEYRDTRVSPTVSLIFKPVETVSVYASYIESLEKGGTSGTTFGGFPVVNPDETMPPLVSEQIEIGAKARVHGILFTGALFEIDKGLQYYDVTVPTAPVYVQDGRQVHRGFEFTATGQATERLTLLGGFTVLDAKIKENASNPLFEGKTPPDVAEFFAKLYAEYDLGEPSGLILTGGLFYTGSQYVNNTNTDKIPDFLTGDLGFRYETRVSDLPLTFRLNVSNVTNENYWLKSNYVGAPRTVRVSTTLEF
ncbi:MAG: TonB-dependent siderophore receptor [Rariglobus sp.]|jgi:iron complex outermembrane receptor protein|nr:TonB-dependent siderophore receptor [Rariglobus sp.]